MEQSFQKVKLCLWHWPKIAIFLQKMLGKILIIFPYTLFKNIATLAVVRFSLKTKIMTARYRYYN